MPITNDYCTDVRDFQLEPDEFANVAQQSLMGDGGGAQMARAVLLLHHADTRLHCFDALIRLAGLWQRQVLEIAIDDNPDLAQELFCLAKYGPRLDAASRQRAYAVLLNPAFSAAMARFLKALRACYEAACCDEGTAICGPAPQESIGAAGYALAEAVEVSLGEYDQMRLRELIVEGRRAMSVLTHDRVAEQLLVPTPADLAGILRAIDRFDGRPPQDYHGEVAVMGSLRHVFTWLSDIQQAGAAAAVTPATVGGTIDRDWVRAAAHLVTVTG